MNKLLKIQSMDLSRTRKVMLVGCNNLVYTWAATIILSIDRVMSPAFFFVP